MFIGFWKYWLIGTIVKSPIFWGLLLFGFIGSQIEHCGRNQEAWYAEHCMNGRFDFSCIGEKGTAEQEKIFNDERDAKIKEDLHIKFNLNSTQGDKEYRQCGLATKCIAKMRKEAKQKKNIAKVDTTILYSVAPMPHI